MSLYSKRIISAFGILAVVLFGAAARSEEGADANAGEVIFKRCMTCHQVGPTAKNTVGPILNGVVGRAAGTYPRYRYSAANKNSGVIWDRETLTEFLRSPKSFMPGTKMAFPGVRDDADIANLIAFLQSFDESGEAVED